MNDHVQNEVITAISRTEVCICGCDREGSVNLNEGVAERTVFELVGSNGIITDEVSACGACVCLVVLE